jgi:hypothetical protein
MIYPDARASPDNTVDNSFDWEDCPHLTTKPRRNAIIQSRNNLASEII